jgi:eukaryotic-like serine/threonine-protein kinase
MAAMAAPPLAGFAIEVLLGRGGMAEVHLARALRGPLVGRAVAVKRLLPGLARDPAQVELFRREGELTRQLHHPAIVTVFDTGVSGGTPYMVLEYVDGRNLRQILSQCAARKILLPVDFAAYLAHVVAEALDYAHSARDAAGRPLGIVHCDVSPSNLFISRLGEVKLGDFGVARTAGAGSASPAAFGKVRYLAPEQIRGEPVTPAADLFALGAVLFELLTDEPAFAGADVNEVGQRILRGERRGPRELRPAVPGALDAVVRKALSADPAQRFGSAAEMAAEIAAHYDPGIGTPLAIAAVVRGLFGASAS